MRIQQFIFCNIVLLVICTLSCKKFLHIPVEAELPSSSLDKTKASNMLLPLSAAYASLRLEGVSAFPYIGMFEIASDMADKGSSPDDNPEMKTIDNFTVLPTNSHVNSFWVDHYNAISQCNNALITIAQFRGYIPPTDTVKIEQYRAEASFLRAYLYFNLNRAFGGVPIIDTILSSSQLAQKKRATTQEVYAFIEQELIKDTVYLPVSYPQIYAGRITKYAAIGLLAKVQLYQGKYADALKNAMRVINSGKYSLDPDYMHLFSVDGENGVESLFEIQSSDLGWLNSTTGSPFTNYGFEQGPRNNAPSNMQGWGFCVPSQALVDALNARGETIRKETILLQRGTIRGIDNDSIKTSCPNPYYNGKVFVPSSLNTWSYNGYAFNHNPRILRYADILLIAAECQLRTSSGDLGATYLNTVRQRAKLSDIPPTLQDIWNERKIEFALEEDRFFDLVRTGQAGTVLAPLGFTAGKNEVYPIPQKQIDVSQGNLTQNLGY